MFILPSLPSAEATLHELADFVELLAWTKAAISTTEVVSYLRQIGENEVSTGIEDDDDKYIAKLEEVMEEVERRVGACGKGYPFRVDSGGNILTSLADDKQHQACLYRYLLLCTRLNMRDDKEHSKLDGTKLFEEVSAHVLRCYLGSSRANSTVFGTSVAGGFSSKIDKLCELLGEGNGFRAKDKAPITANDDKLDAVAWVPFSDKNESQLIIFGQCKTGSTWRHATTQLVPEKFVGLWMHNPFFVIPVRAFCVAESTDRDVWAREAMYAGLMFDRCRLVDFCEAPDADLLERVNSWTQAAYATVDLSGKRSRRLLRKKRKAQSAL